MVSVVIIQLGYCIMKATTDNHKQMDMAVYQQNFICKKRWKADLAYSS